MVQVRLTDPFRFVIVGAPSYLAHHGEPEKPQDLLRHECITFRSQTNGALYAWELERGRKTWRVPVRGAVVVGPEAELMIFLAEQGLGLAYVFEPMVREALRKGRLRRVLDAYSPTRGNEPASAFMRISWRGDRRSNGATRAPGAVTAMGELSTASPAHLGAQRRRSLSAARESSARLREGLFSAPGQSPSGETTDGVLLRRVDEEVSSCMPTCADQTATPSGAASPAAEAPRKLSTEGAPAGVDPNVGDIAYYASWGNLAIYYRDFGYSSGLVKLGTLEGGPEELTRAEVEVRFERIVE